MRLAGMKYEKIHHDPSSALTIVQFPQKVTVGIHQKNPGARKLWSEPRETLTLSRLIDHLERKEIMRGSLACCYDPKDQQLPALPPSPHSS
jgi:hypothetical protein